jgi:hypothetical protein
MVDSHHSGMHNLGPDETQQETSFVVALLLNAYDPLFGCCHAKLSRVFTINRETYRLCLECGAKFSYSMETMSFEKSENGGVHEAIGVLHPASCDSTLGCR